MTGMDKANASQSEKIYDFNVECDGKEKHVLELFLASLSSNEFASKRFKEEDGALYKRTGTRRKSVKIRDARCEQVPEKVRTYPSDAEARRACRGSPTPMGCEMEYQGRDKWVTEMVERCYRARYEMRDVPRWTAFPFGYAPLPKGARIKKRDRAQSCGRRQQVKTQPASRMCGRPAVFRLRIQGRGLERFSFSHCSWGPAPISISLGWVRHHQRATGPVWKAGGRGITDQQDHTFDEPQYEASSGGLSATKLKQVRSAIW